MSFSGILDAVVIINKLTKSAILIFRVMLMNDVNAMKGFFLEFMVMRIIAINLMTFLNKIY
jgi:hypothetical protein